MAQPIYSTSVQITQFSGLNQSGDGFNQNMQYAWEMENVNVTGGSFQPMRTGRQIPQELSGPIGTLAYLHRRFGNTGTLMVAISGGKVWTKLLDGDDEWVERYSGLTSDDNDWVTYEISALPYAADKAWHVGELCSYSSKYYRCNTAIGAAGEAWNAAHWTEIEGKTENDPTDILLFSNAVDGMHCLYGDTLEVVTVPTPKLFGVITRYNERIWGAGILGDPDMLVYSSPFNPFNWDQVDEIPEDGAGDIQQPTWDGDSFVALRQYGANLLAIKRNAVWRIYGTNPGEFQMQQEYGGGTIVENTVAVYNDMAYMLGENGIIRYDGTGAYPFLQEQIKEIFKTVNRDALKYACGAMRDGVYCLALPVNGSEYCNTVLEYNTKERSISFRTETSVGSFMTFNERLFYTSATSPGRVHEMRDDVGEIMFARWISGYQDLGLKSSIKSAFILYMMVDSEAPVELRIGLRTEKKLKQKIINTKPGKMTRLHLNTQGRIFRLEIRSYSAVPFTISGGIKLDLELDPD